MKIGTWCGGMVIKKPLYKCVKCKYKTTLKLKKIIHEKSRGHRMEYIGCQKRMAKNKIEQKFDM